MSDARTESGQRIAIHLLFASVVATAAASLLFAQPVVVRAIVPARHRVDLARATVEELALLPEVGTQRAARIALHRATVGPCESVEDLALIAGLSSSHIAALQNDVRLDADSNQDSNQDAHRIVKPSPFPQQP